MYFLWLALPLDNTEYERPDKASHPVKQYPEKVTCGVLGGLKAKPVVRGHEAKVDRQSWKPEGAAHLSSAILENGKIKLVEDKFG